MCITTVLILGSASPITTRPRGSTLIRTPSSPIIIESPTDALTKDEGILFHGSAALLRFANHGIALSVKLMILGKKEIVESDSFLDNLLSFLKVYSGTSPSYATSSVAIQVHLNALSIISAVIKDNGISIEINLTYQIK